jgi:peptide/nickel transport system permease protein
VLEVIGVTLYPIPYYILALVLIILFAYIWPIFPLSTTIVPGALTLQKVGEILRNSFLPGMALVLAGFGWNVLGMKAMAYSTKEEAFVNYARLKGVPSFTIMTQYVFRNAFLPQITALALHIGMIFNGAILTEMLFSYPGVGSLIRSAIGNGDYNMIYGTLSLSIVAVATAALAIDLAYPLFDPRIRYK